MAEKRKKTPILSKLPIHGRLDDTFSDHAKRIEKALHKRGIGIDAFCFMAQIDRSTWTRWKNGTSSPSYLSMYRIETALVSQNISLDGKFK